MESTLYDMVESLVNDTRRLHEAVVGVMSQGIVAELSSDRLPTEYQESLVLLIGKGISDTHILVGLLSATITE